jgi:hypothetical protein
LADPPSSGRRLWRRLLSLVTPRPPRGEFFGTPGQRVQVHLTVDSMRDLPSGGVLHKLHDTAGNSFTWEDDGEPSGMQPGGSYYLNATVLDHRVERNVRVTHVHRVGPASGAALPEAETIPGLISNRSARASQLTDSHWARGAMAAVGAAVLIGATLVAYSWLTGGNVSQPPQTVSTLAPSPRPTEISVPRPAAAPVASPASSPVAPASPEPTIAYLYITGGGNAGVSLRAEPGTAAQRLALLRDGTQLEDRREERDVEGRTWRQVAQPGGDTGWVASEFLTNTRPAQPPASPVPAGSPSALLVRP